MVIKYYKFVNFESKKEFFKKYGDSFKKYDSKLVDDIKKDDWEKTRYIVSEEEFKGINDAFSKGFEDGLCLFRKTDYTKNGTLTPDENLSFRFFISKDNKCIKVTPIIMSEDIFMELPRKKRITANEKSRDRYSDIGSTSPMRSKRAVFEDTEYITKRGTEINASKVVKINSISGSKGKISLIATQCPMENTLMSFWDLILDSKTDLICVFGDVNNNKLIDYWGKDKENRLIVGTKFTKNTEDSLEKLIGQRKKDKENMYYWYSKQQGGDSNNYTTYNVELVRILNGSKQQKTVILKHYYKWPDCGVPNPEGFEEFVLKTAKENCRKIVAHCSAGIGRTGTFAACMYALNSKGKSPKEIVNDMRKYRTNMVQTKEQFNIICRFIIRNCIGLSDKDELPEMSAENIDYIKYFEK